MSVNRRWLAAHIHTAHCCSRDVIYCWAAALSASTVSRQTPHTALTMWQVAAVLTATGRIAAATYRKTLRISTGRRIYSTTDSRCLQMAHSHWGNRDTSLHMVPTAHRSFQLLWPTDAGDNMPQFHTVHAMRPKIRSKSENVFNERINVTPWVKKQDTVLWFVTSPNVSRFSKFFHC